MTANSSLVPRLSLCPDENEMNEAMLTDVLKQQMLVFTLNNIKVLP